MYPKNQNQMDSGRIYLGKLNRSLTRNKEDGSRNCEAWLEWELRKQKPGQVEFTASGEVWNNRKTDAFSAGQNVDKLAALFPENQQAQALCEVWKHWHLNAMHAGTPEQEAVLKGFKVATIKALQVEAEVLKSVSPEAYSNVIRLFYDDDKMQDPNWYAIASHFGCESYYDWACDSLKKACVYEVPYTAEVEKAAGTVGEEHPKTYAYGHGWLYQPLPQEVLDTIKRRFLPAPSIEAEPEEAPHP